MGDVSWIGDMDLRSVGDLAGKVGEEWLDGPGEIDGDEGPGVVCSVGALDV